MNTRLFPLLLSLLCCPPLHVLAEEKPALAIPATDEGLPGAGPVRRMEWFQDLWLQRRAAWAEQVARDQGAVVFLGDSITQGWGDDAGKSFGAMKIANRGISGDTTRGMLIRLKEDVLSLNPAAVVILAGTNDLEEKATPEIIAGNIRLLLAALKAQRADLPVVLCKVLPSSASKSRPADQIKAINKLLAAAVRDQPQVTLVETWKPFADAAGDALPAEFPDLLHPNEAGYRKWAAALRPVLATLGLVETEPDPFQPEPGFTSLFNGRDLTGWKFKDGAPFDGQVRSSDQRYFARNGRLIVTTPSEGSKIAQLWTVREFPKNFTLRLEFRATPNADSGVFLRGPQLQCRDYPLAGPYKNLTQYKPQDWNEMEVTVTGGTARCTCNGEVLEAAYPLPATGPIGLEGDSGQMEYRRIRVKEE
ncbi:MAG: GDSL-type esterase/lipase family protein [Verrucomicrobiota bacterium]